MQEIYEKLGLFYLGKEIDAQTMQQSDTLTLLKNKNFTTHAAIIGMTGSGKTGLGITLIEEAAIDNIPSLIIDPKGDMGNLCFTDPHFLPEAFEPWVREEARIKETDSKVYAQKQATAWKEGIESWHQSAERVQKFHEVQKYIYTPGGSAGLPINILSSLDVPPPEVMQESDTFASYLKSTTSSLLSLVGIEADPLASKEYILLAHIIMQAWLASENLSIESIIGKIINPPFKKIGVLVLDDFYDKEARFGLATKFNALLASPSFSLWLEGDTLDIQKLLYDEKGKAKIAIFTLSHLNDTERMFFVTLLLNKYIAWMRMQSGTVALKTVLYMDEIFGFFPPTKNPPSKEPMLLLLKQARAFGVGVVLSTQNPVDLDYKGLSNIATWFIGRLQTAQDIDRVIEGLGGKIDSSLDKPQLRALLSNLKERTFFIKSAHLDDVKLFSVRWVLSYLKGPLSKEEISGLMQTYKQKQDAHIADVSTSGKQVSMQSYQSIDASILQYFEPDISSMNHFLPYLAAKGTTHFYHQSKGVDEKKSFILFLALEEDQQRIVWEEAREEDIIFERYPNTTPQGALYNALPEIILSDKGLKKASNALKEMLYRQESLVLYRCDALKMESRAHETESGFKVRLQDVLGQKKELEIEKLQDTYAKREKTLLTRLSRTQAQLEKESTDSTGSMVEAGIAILGALLGRGSATSIGRAASKGSKVLKERTDMSHAEERNTAVQEEITQLENELEDKITVLTEKYSIDSYAIDTFALKPKKSDIAIELCAIVWQVG